MKQTVNLHDFREAFKQMERTNFSYKGLGHLFEYLENYEDETGEEIELDPIALCCEYSEYDSIEEAIDAEGYEDMAELFEGWLRDRTSIVCFEPDCTIIQDF